LAINFVRTKRGDATEYARRFVCEKGFRDAKWYLGRDTAMFCVTLSRTVSENAYPANCVISNPTSKPADRSSFRSIVFIGTRLALK
jgi:hypothetical protein